MRLGADHDLAWGNGDTCRGLRADETLYYNTETHTERVQAGTRGSQDRAQQSGPGTPGPPAHPILKCNA
jgi:hypothetical protein